MLEREDAIREMIAAQAPRREIVNVLSEKFGIAQRTVQDHYYAISKAMADELDKHKDEVALWAVESNKDLYKRCLKMHKYKTASDIINSICKLAGLFDAKGVISRDVPKINIIEADYSAPLKAVGEGSEETEGS